VLSGDVVRVPLVFQLATLAAIAYGLWRGAAPLALMLMAAGLAVHAVLIVRLARASLGGVGAHADWIRARSTRPRLRRSPAWHAGTALVVAGLGVALWG
jgi:hypothetical protein